MDEEAKVVANITTAVLTAARWRHRTASATGSATRTDYSVASCIWYFDPTSTKL